MLADRNKPCLLEQPDFFLSQQLPLGLLVEISAGDTSPQLGISPISPAGTSAKFQCLYF